MRLHATRTNLPPSALDNGPSTRTLASSRSFPFIAPLRLRWSPVVFPREMPSISFFLCRYGTLSLTTRGVYIPTPLNPRTGQHPLPRRSILLTLLLSHSCTLFCTADLRNCFCFNCFHTLWQKPPGVGTYSPSRTKLPPVGRNHRKAGNAGLAPQTAQRVPTNWGKARRYKNRRSGHDVSCPYEENGKENKEPGLRRSPLREETSLTPEDVSYKGARNANGNYSVK